MGEAVTQLGLGEWAGLVLDVALRRVREDGRAFCVAMRQHIPRGFAENSGKTGS